MIHLSLPCCLFLCSCCFLCVKGKRDGASCECQRVVYFGTEHVETLTFIRWAICVFFSSVLHALAHRRSVPPFLSVCVWVHLISQNSIHHGRRLCVKRASSLAASQLCVNSHRPLSNVVSYGVIPATRKHAFEDYCDILCLWWRDVSLILSMKPYQNHADLLQLVCDMPLYLLPHNIQRQKHNQCSYYCFTLAKIFRFVFREYIWTYSGSNSWIYRFVFK